MWTWNFYLSLLCERMPSPNYSVKIKLLSRVWLFATLWTIAHQAPPPMGFSRQEYWSGLPFPSPGDLPDSGIEPRSPTLQADALTSEPPGKPWCPNYNYSVSKAKEVFPSGSVVKNMATMQENWVRSLGPKDSLEKGIATHSSIPAWRISLTEEPGGLQSMGSQRVRHGWATNTNVCNIQQILMQILKK